jgi:hypothetical protein
LKHQFYQVRNYIWKEDIRESISVISFISFPSFGGIYSNAETSEKTSYSSFSSFGLIYGNAETLEKNKRFQLFQLWGKPWQRRNIGKG